MIDNNSTNFEAQDLFDKLLNDEEWEPDPEVRKKAAALMRVYYSQS